VPVWQALSGTAAIQVTFPRADAGLSSDRFIATASQSGALYLHALGMAAALLESGRSVREFGVPCRAMAGCWRLLRFRSLGVVAAIGMTAASSELLLFSGVPLLRRCGCAAVDHMQTALIFQCLRFFVASGKIIQTAENSLGGNLQKRHGLVLSHTTR
jgi:hypothetical protein